MRNGPVIPVSKYRSKEMLAIRELVHSGKPGKADGF